MDSALAEIDRSVGNVDNFKRVLEQFVGELSGSAQAVDFKNAAAEAPLWKEVDVWNRFIDRWHKTDVARLDAVHAKQMLTACTDILRDHDGHPAALELRGRVPYLEAILRRTDDSGGKLHGPLNELFTDPLVAGLWMVETVDDKENVTRYYLVTPPPQASESQKSIQVAYILDFSRTANHKKTIPVKSITYSGQAPQSIVAKATMDELAKLNEELWESAFAKVIGTINSDKRLEPILKVLFLQKVLDVACQGSESLRAAFAQFKDVLGTVAIDPAVPWMDFNNEDARRSRACRRSLESLAGAATGYRRSGAKS